MALADALGNLIDFRLLPGQAHDLRGTAALTQTQAASRASQEIGTAATKPAPPQPSDRLQVSSPMVRATTNRSPSWWLRHGTGSASGWTSQSPAQAPRDDASATAPVR